MVGLTREASAYVAAFFFFQAEDGIRDIGVTGVQTCALPISLPSAGGKALGLAADSSKRDEIDKVIEAADRALGRIDILVNNAGIGAVKPAAELTEADVDRVLRSEERRVGKECRSRRSPEN